MLSVKCRRHQAAAIVLVHPARLVTPALAARALPPQSAPLKARPAMSGTWCSGGGEGALCLKNKLEC